jgi:hypothetical protein
MRLIIYLIIFFYIISIAILFCEIPEAYTIIIFSTLFTLLGLYALLIAVVIINGIKLIIKKKKESQNTNDQDHLSIHNFSRCEKWYRGRTYKRIKK